MMKLTEYEFQLFCRCVATADERFLDRLYESGCDDAAVFYKDGYLCLRDYVVYVVTPDFSPEDEAMVKSQWETSVDGHAGEKEMSAILAIRPDLVHRDTLPTDKEGYPHDRLKTLRDLGVDVGIWWYADYPSHYCGDEIPATAENGNNWLDARARAFAKAIRAIKDDTETKRLQDEFFGRI